MKRVLSCLFLASAAFVQSCSYGSIREAREAGLMDVIVETYRGTGMVQEDTDLAIGNPVVIVTRRRYQSTKLSIYVEAEGPVSAIRIGPTEEFYTPTGTTLFVNVRIETGVYLQLDLKKDEDHIRGDVTLFENGRPRWMIWNLRAENSETVIEVR